MPELPPPPPAPEEDDHESAAARLRRAVIGAPRDLKDRSLFHQLALIPVLAWVGLGADALSSSAYGPEEAFKAIAGHEYLAVALAAATALTVALISAAYARLVERFPNGGGYGVASAVLGAPVGLVSGCALMVDYVLTVTISIAAAGDALFSFAPATALWQDLKLPSEVGLLIVLTAINIRGVRESVQVLAPMFLLFLLTHALLIGAGVIEHATRIGETARAVARDFHAGVGALGAGGVLALLVRAYSMGGGTYTGIEAVSNALPLMREPRVRTAQRTMAYLAVSLAVTAGGLLLCYLLWHTVPPQHQTMNAALAESVFARWPGARVFVLLTLLSEAMLLIVAAQAGFIGGPRVLANMAVDGWMPHGFSSLSERLTTENGILVMSGAALAALAYTRGDTHTIVVMYSINVFLTFSLTMASMVLYWWRHPPAPERARRLALFAVNAALCATILAITIFEKFSQGAWLTMACTGALIAACVLVRRHYVQVRQKATRLYAALGELPLAPEGTPPLPAKRGEPTAVVLVGGFNSLGIHTFLTTQRVFPGYFRQVVFVSVGVLDSGSFKGEDAAPELEARTRGDLEKYVRLATRLGLPAEARWAIGTDAVELSEELCLVIAKDRPRSVFFAGKLIFEHERWYHRFLHNNTAQAIQKRLHAHGSSMMILPARIR